MWLPSMNAKDTFSSSFEALNRCAELMAIFRHWMRHISEGFRGYRGQCGQPSTVITRFPGAPVPRQRADTQRRAQLQNDTFLLAIALRFPGCFSASAAVSMLNAPCAALPLCGTASLRRQHTTDDPESNPASFAAPPCPGYLSHFAPSCLARTCPDRSP